MSFRLLSVLLLFLFVAVSPISFGQAEHVPCEHKVYGFLDRMAASGMLRGYNAFEIPKSRGEILNSLHRVQKQEESLAILDRLILSDLLVEFDTALHETAKRSLIGGSSYDFFSQEPKYLYSFADKKRGNIFVNLTAEAGTLHADEKAPAQYGVLGGEIRGTLHNRLGFFLKGANGMIFGERAAAMELPRFRNNWKLNSTPTETFFDVTAGYGTLDFPSIKVKLGRDNFAAGYGAHKLLFRDGGPQLDHISLRLTLGDFTYTSIHAKLLGAVQYLPDPVTGGSAQVDEKFIGYHRLSFSASKHITLGAGEMIIYAQRPIDIGYLNPFAFYKTVEHGNQDRDNSMLFFDAANNSFDGVRLYTVFLLDDIDYSKLGSGWYGNQFAWNIGAQVFTLNKIIPMDFSVEYFRIEPYVFSHRLPSRNYTSKFSRLGVNLDPNSGMLAATVVYRLSHRLSLTLGLDYTEHGANPTGPSGTINVGGSVFLGHRVFDATNVSFLDGDREYMRGASLYCIWEPVIGGFASIRLRAENNHLQNAVKENLFLGEMNFTIRF